MTLPLTGDLTIASRHERHIIRLERLCAECRLRLEAKGYITASVLRLVHGPSYYVYAYIDYWIGEDDANSPKTLYLHPDVREPSTTDEDFLAAAVTCFESINEVPDTHDATLAALVRMSEEMRELGEAAGLSPLFLNPIVEFAESIRHNVLEDKTRRQDAKLPGDTIPF